MSPFAMAIAYGAWVVLALIASGLWFRYAQPMNEHIHRIPIGANILIAATLGFAAGRAIMGFITYYPFLF